MMSAKVGTGIVAELGAMRISDEIDALEVMGIDSVTFLCATRLLAAWIVLPFMYVGAIGVEQPRRDRKSTRLNSSHRCISYAVFCLKKKKSCPHRLDNGKIDRQDD